VLGRLFILYFVRAPVTQCRLLAGNPSAAAVAALAALFIGFAWFDQGARRRFRAVRQLSLCLAFVVGIVGFLWFMRGGHFAWDFAYDSQQNWKYLVVLRQAVVRNELPYYMYEAHQETERYIANVETTIPPYALLLKIMDVTPFFIAHLLIAVALGSIALYLLKQELNLSTFSWSFFVTVFLFNGHITTQLSLIRTQWVGYFLLPWTLLCCVRLAAGDTSLRNSGVFALTMATTLFFGAWHIFMWTLIFLLFLSVSSVRSFVFALKTIGLVALLAAARLLPGILTFGAGATNFISGFDRLSFYVQALAGEGAGYGARTEWYEYDTYVGYVGFVLVCLGLIPRPAGALSYLNKLLVPVFALLVLSYDRVYEYTLFRLPGFVSERYALRLVIVPTLVLTLLGCVRVDRFLSTRPRFPVRLAFLFAAWFLVVQLVLRAYYNRPPTVGRGDVLTLDALKHVPVEAGYWWAVWIGIVVSTATSLWLAWQTLWRGASGN